MNQCWTTITLCFLLPPGVYIMRISHVVVYSRRSRVFGDIFVIETIWVCESLKNLHKISQLKVKNKNMRALSLLC